MPTRLRGLVVGLLVLPLAAGAQGTLSTQGFGYPSGQMSTRTLGTGGAMADIDPLSVTNPASLVNIGTSALYFQAEPEYRTILLGGETQHNTLARFPLVVGSIPITPTLFAGISVSSLLDRSFKTVGRSTQIAGTDLVASTNTFSSDGAIGDVRLAVAWAPMTWLHVGAAAHAITGDNRLVSQQHFDDSTRYATINDSSTVTYVGNAFSGGVEVYAGRYAVVAASYRRGGPLSLKRRDTTLGNARVPDRVAFSAAFLGIRGTTLAIRTAKEGWNAMEGLGSPGMPISEGWDTSVGGDVLGPRFAGRTIQLRGGARWRTLPFDVPASLGVTGSTSGPVTEHSYSFGAGTLLARGRAAVDLTAIHSARRSDATLVQENAWTMSVGITVRP